MNVLAAIVIGVVTLGSIYWQGYIFNKDSQKHRQHLTRLVVPFYSGAIVVLGIFVYGIIAIFQGHVEDIGGFWPWVGRVILAIFFASFLIFKACFSAILVGFVASSFCYSFIIFGEIHPIPILGALINLVFPQAPQWLHILYVSAVSIYGLIASIGDSFDWDWGGLDWNIICRWFSD